MATETVDLARVEIGSGTGSTAPPPAAYPQRLRVLELLLVMGVAILPLIANSAFAFWVGDSDKSFIRFRIASLIFHECSSLAVFFYVLSRQGRTLRDVGLEPRWTDLGIGALLAIGALVAASSSYSVVYVWQQLTGGTAQPSSSVVNALAQFSLVSVALVLVNPFFEEVLVRGYFTSELALLTRSRWIPLVAGVLLQSSYHLYQGIPSMIAVGASFLIFAFYFGETRRLGPVILAHFYLDAFALLRSA